MKKIILIFLLLCGVMFNGVVYGGQIDPRVLQRAEALIKEKFHCLESKYDPYWLERKFGFEKKYDDGILGFKVIMILWNGKYEVWERRIDLKKLMEGDWTAW